MLEYDLSLRHSSNKIYKCDNLSSFFHTLIEKMECMDPQRLCSTLTAFVDRLVLYAAGGHILPC